MLRFYRKKLDFAIFTFFASMAVFISCISILVIYFVSGQLSEKKVNELNTLVDEVVEEKDDTVDRYASLRDEYPDLVGFVTYNYYNKKMKLPLMQTNDNDYYLYRDVKGKSSQRGTAFIDYRCDVKNSLLLVLYAHNMNDLSQFGALKEYRKESYWKKYPYIYFETQYEEKEAYEVVSYSEIFSDEKEDVFRYYTYFDLPNQAQYGYYIYNIKKMALYPTGIRPKFGEKLILLSTCDHTQHKREGRFAVLARKVEDEQNNMESIGNSTNLPNNINK